ncbi:MAG: iron-containing alcohol dehydrogenase [Kiritimatiellia bacterium]
MQSFSDRFRENFPPDTSVLIVADLDSWNLAGREVYGELRNAGVPVAKPCVFETEPALSLAAQTRILDALSPLPKTQPRAILAVGGGRLADLAKCAATAAFCSYAIYITIPDTDSLASPYLTDEIAALPLLRHSPFRPLAPVFTYADPARILYAPGKGRSAGYGDLFGKFTAGADWILAEAVTETDPIPQKAWEILQNGLTDWTIHPKELSQNDPSANEALLTGLLAAGASAALARSKRPCEGAEHLFAQTWAMSAAGKQIPHGHLVALGTLCSLAFYVTLFKYEFSAHSIPDALATYPTWNEREPLICSLLPDSPLRHLALAESRAKHLSPEALADRLRHLASIWPDLRDRLSRQLMYFPRMRAMLLCAECPITPADIGFSPARLAASAIVAQMLSRRYSVLDFAYETGTFAACIASLQDAFEIDDAKTGKSML